MFHIRVETKGICIAMVEKKGYVKINDGTTVYHYPEDLYVAVVLKNENGHTKRSIKDIKKSAIQILLHINGLRTVDDLYYELTQKYDIEFSAFSKFLEDSIKIGILTIVTNPEECSLKIVGDGINVLPRHATIEITEKCNLKCTYCYNEAMPTKGKHMPIESVYKLFDILSLYGVTIIEISGGEPMLHPEIDKILSYAFEKFRWVAILSNGVYFPRKILPIIENNRDKLGGIQISIDGSNEEISRKVRQVNNTCKKSFDTISLLLSKNFLVRVVIVLTEDNIYNLKDTCELMRQMGVKHFGISVAEEWGRGKEIDNQITENHKSYKSYFLAKYREILRKINEEYKDIIFNKRALKNIDYSAIKNCGAGWQTIAITVDGNIKACAPGRIFLGNVFCDNYLKVFSQSQVYKMAHTNFRELRELYCLECSYNHECTMCYSQVLTMNQKRIKEGKDICPVIKEIGLEKLV